MTKPTVSKHKGWQWRRQLREHHQTTQKLL